ncbi:MAG: DUF222 domain-containing protein [Propionicimonas sp.]|nr:DUF222 domain-containing protein [Propionicimonas sp.]
MFELVDVSRMDAAAALDVVEAAERAGRLVAVQRALAMLRVVRTYRGEVPADKVEIGADGTPQVDDFACLELAAALHREPVGVRVEVAELVTLQARHPRLWVQALAGEFPLWQARKIARQAWELPLELALWVDVSMAPFIGRLSFGRLARFVDALVAQADPQAANERFELARRSRRVTIGESSAGVSPLYGLVDAADGIYLDAALARFADILAACGDTAPVEIRRATALGILATPARALAMLQAATQPVLVGAIEEDPARVARDAETVADEFGPRSPQRCAGHTCGTITVDPDRLLPKATLVVHLSEHTLDAGRGLARATGVGAVTLEQLHVLLHNKRITVQPVLDTDGITAVDSYEIPAAIRRAVLARHPWEVWPYGGRSSAKLDLDHTRPYRWDGTPGQTSVSNLGPLSRKAHRAKTHAGWQVSQDGAGTFCWTSPLGRHYLVAANGLTYATGASNRGRPGPAAPGAPPLLPDLPHGDRKTPSVSRPGRRHGTGVRGRRTAARRPGSASLATRRRSLVPLRR